MADLFDWFLGVVKWRNPKPELPEFDSWSVIAEMAKVRSSTIRDQVWEVFRKSGLEFDARRDRPEGPFIGWLEERYGMTPNYAIRMQIGLMLKGEPLSAKDVCPAFGKDTTEGAVRDVALFFRRPVRLFDLRVYVLAVLGLDFEKGAITGSLSSHVSRYNRSKRQKLIYVTENVMADFINEQRRDASGTLDWRSLTEILQSNIDYLDAGLPSMRAYTRAREIADNLRPKRASQHLMVYLGPDKVHETILKRLRPMYEVQATPAEKTGLADYIHSEYEYFY